MDTRGLEQAWQKLEEKYSRYLPDINWKDPGSTVEVPALVGGLARYFSPGRANASLLGQLIILAVVSALIGNLQAFSSQGVAQVGRAVVFMVLFSVSILIQLGGGPGPGQCAGYDRYGFGLGRCYASAGCLGQHYGSGNLPAFVVDHCCCCWQCGGQYHPAPAVCRFCLGSSKSNAGRGRYRQAAGLLKDISVWLLGFLVTVFVG